MSNLIHYYHFEKGSSSYLKETFLSSFFLDNKIETGLFSFHLQETIIPMWKKTTLYF